MSIKEIQQGLKRVGLYSGQIDGIWGKGSKGGWDELLQYFKDGEGISDSGEEFKPAPMYRVSEQCFEVVKHFEKFMPNAYIDAVGVVTLGYGETLGVKMGDTTTEIAATEQLIRRMEKDYANHVRSLVKVEITQGMFDGMCSMTYNVGVSAFSNSTLLRKLNAGDYQGAADQFLVWNKGTINGKKVVLNGLTRRRQCERAMFLGEDFKQFIY